MNNLLVTANNYINDPKMRKCLEENHSIYISKPYGVVIDCNDCNKTFLFNWEY